MWCRYSLPVSAQIAAAKASGAVSVTFDCTNDQHEKHEYQINFTAMQQENMVHKTKRKVRTLPASQLANKFSCSRKFWASSEQKGLDGDKLFVVGSGSNEYAAVVAQFLQTMSGTTVDKLERIENGDMHESFEVKASAMQREVGDKWDTSMKRLLFHGTQAIDGIVNSADGFLPLLSGSATGALYGNGTYFARDASYSDSYASRASGGQKQLIVADVLVGRSTRGISGMAQYPLLPGEKHKRFTSLVNNTNDPSIFVVQNSSHAYPAYVITYH